MFLFQQYYRNLFIIIVSLLLLVPCSLKRELKHFISIETTPTSPVGNNKLVCTSFVDSSQSIKNQKEKKSILPPFDENNFSFIHVSVEQKTAFSSFFTDQKEKIPTYLLYEKFLI